MKSLCPYSAGVSSLFQSWALTLPLFLPVPGVQHPLICPLQTVQIQIHSPVFFLSLSVFLCSSHSLCTSTAGLQRAATYTGGARCRGDLDRQGSDPHQREAAGNAARFRQVPAAEHQAPRRRCAPLLVSSSFKLNIETKSLYA